MWGKNTPTEQGGPAAAAGQGAGVKPAKSGPCGHGCGCHGPAGSLPSDESREPTSDDQPGRDDVDEYGDAGGPVGAIDPDAIAARDDDAAGLLGRLEAERDEWKTKCQRLMADFQNYQRRALANEDQAREQATRAVVSSLVLVLDHFQLALMVDPAKTTAQQVVQGVSVIRDEMLKVLGRHGVTVLAPKPNDEFDPARHEAIMQAKAEGVQPGRVAAMLQEGFMVNDKVLRPAKVSVAPAE